MIEIFHSLTKRRDNLWLMQLSYLFSLVPTLQKFPNFGRTYAAYGGVFIFLAILWGWGIDKKIPDIYDWIGAAICLVGVSIMLWAPRH